MSSFLCFVCHSTVNADTNEDTREKYREVIGMNLCPDSHLCYICCYFLNKMWMFKSICLKRSLEYPVLFSEKGTINLHRSETSISILCPENVCVQHLNTRYHFYNNNDNSQSDFDDNNYCELQDDRNFDISDTLLRTVPIENFRNEDYLFVTKDNDDNLFNEELIMPNLEPVRITQNDLVNGEWTQNIPKRINNRNSTLIELNNCKHEVNIDGLVLPVVNNVAISNNLPMLMRINDKDIPMCTDTQNLQDAITGLNYTHNNYVQVENCVNENLENNLFGHNQQNLCRNISNNNMNYGNVANINHSLSINDKMTNIDNLSHINDKVTNISNLSHLNNKVTNIDNFDCLNVKVTNIDNTAPRNDKMTNIDNLTHINDKVTDIANLSHLNDKVTDINNFNMNDRVSNIEHLSRMNEKLTNIDHLTDMTDKITNIKNLTSIDDKHANIDHISHIKDKTTNIENLTHINDKVTNIDISDIADKATDINVIAQLNEKVSNIDNLTQINTDLTKTYDNVSQTNNNPTETHNDDDDISVETNDLNENDNTSNDNLDLNDDMANDSGEEISENSDSESKDKVKSKKSKKDLFKKIFLTLEEQKMELEKARKDGKYIAASYNCHSCAMYFHFKDTYQTHMMRHEESNGEHFCSLCSLRFANPAVLRSHMANHGVRYRCRVCHDAVRATQRPTHARRCAGAGRAARCDLCQKVFQSPPQLQQHLRRYHGSNHRRYICNVCGETCTSRPKLRTHIITHINRKFDCDQCSSTFSSPYTLNRHKKSKHQYKEPELHHCAVCKLTYSTRKSLLAHLRNALAHKESVYKCGECGRLCPSMSSLQAHTAAVHARSSHLPCTVCRKLYSTTKALVRHMSSHKEGRSEPLCHLCGATFKSTSTLKKHLKNVCEKEKTKCQIIDEEYQVPFFE